jgi:hypothetical protein
MTASCRITSYGIPSCGIASLRKTSCRKLFYGTTSHGIIRHEAYKLKGLYNDVSDFFCECGCVTVIMYVVCARRHSTALNRFTQDSAQKRVLHGQDHWMAYRKANKKKGYFCLVSDGSF